MCGLFWLLLLLAAEDRTGSEMRDNIRVDYDVFHTTGGAGHHAQNERAQGDRSFHFFSKGDSLAAVIRVRP